jgi:outer membrane protein assembly factor BamD (BamD/ComL family)
MHRFNYVDTTYKRSESAGIACFLLGEIWEKNYMKYDTAMQYYDKSMAAQSPKEYKAAARRKSQDFAKYLSFHTNLNKHKRQLDYILDPQTFLDDSLAYVEYKAEQDSLRDQNQNNNLRGSVDRKRSTTAFGKENLDKSDKKKKKIIIMPKRPKISADSLNSLIAGVKFELGNLFFTELNVPDSTFYYYNDVVFNYPLSSNTPKMLFALGSYFLTVNDSLKADSLFNVVYDNYKNDRIVNEAAKKLGKSEIDFADDPAEDLYLKSENEMFSSNYDVAIEGFYEIFNNYPKSQMAPKSLYTIGWILENNLNYPDSAAAVYDTLSMKYKKSEYAKAVSKKLNFYKAEQKRIRQAIQDSLALVKEEAIQDSIRKAEEEAILKEMLEDDQKSDSLNILENNRYIQSTDSTEIQSDTLINNQYIQNPDSVVHDTDSLKNNKYITHSPDSTLYQPDSLKQKNKK